MEINNVEKKQTEEDRIKQVEDLLQKLFKSGSVPKYARQSIREQIFEKYQSYIKLGNILKNGDNNNGG